MISIRKAKLGDELQIAEVHYSTYLSSYNGVVPKSLLSIYSVNNLSVKWKEQIQASLLVATRKIIFVCERHEIKNSESAKIIGFVSGGEIRELNQDFDAEIYSLFVLTEHQRRGLGSRLVHSFAEWLSQQGYKNMRVQMSEISSSCHFFEKMGGKLQSFDKLSSFPFLSYRWDNLSNLLKNLANCSDKKFVPRSDFSLIESIRDLPSFSQLTDTEILEICRIAELRIIEPGEYLNQEGDASKEIQFILKGQVEMSARGVFLSSVHLGRGNLLGEISYFTGQPYTATPTARTKTEVLVIGHKVMQHFVKENPQIGIKVYRNFTLDIIKKLRGLIEQVLELALGDPSKQLAHDIRSPLAALKVLSSEFPDSNSKDKELLNLVVDRIDRIAATLLSPSSAETPSHRSNNELLSKVSLPTLAKVTEDVVNEKNIQYGPVAHLKTITFTSNLQSNLTAVRINRADFERVISNLIDNSIQAIETIGTVEITLSVTPTANGDVKRGQKW